MIQFSDYPVQTEEQWQQKIKSLAEIQHDNKELQQIYRSILSLVDLTTLEGSDTPDRVSALCTKAYSVENTEKLIPKVAAVCVYPPFVRQCKNELVGKDINVASVAGAFPSGQSPLFVKLEEIKYAVAEGADEIDMVISRGKFLNGELQVVFDEIKAIKAVCKEAHLKVILETGELKTAENIRKASEIAILAGGDFIKTSTGKMQPAATEMAAVVMCETIREYFEKTGIRIGFKPAGGISDAPTAVRYYNIVNSILGKEWLNKHLFRFGASRLVDNLLAAIE
ncbi:MAG TPA: deoxyribose-phosphate aldolase [Bacteroidales bacterium]|nr:deoxyribose-phosphate aldolase [Bacteroidales bacterium]